MPSFAILRSAFHSRDPRGSLLAVAMILPAVMGISLVSYLSPARKAMTISNHE